VLRLSVEPPSEILLLKRFQATRRATLLDEREYLFDERFQSNPKGLGDIHTGGHSQAYVSSSASGGNCFHFRLCAGTIRVICINRGSFRSATLVKGLQRHNYR
jgi:hypothetical protein